MGFSNKVRFFDNGVEYVGRICADKVNGKFTVITTGKNGKLWYLEEERLEKLPEIRQGVVMDF